jgi:hypothetical protein
VIRAQVLRVLQFGAKERSADLGNKFFGGISLVAKAFAEFSVKAMFRAAPVDVMPISA